MRDNQTRGSHKDLYLLLSSVGGARMKRIIVSMAIILMIILATLTLQGCFTPYPEGSQRPPRYEDSWQEMHR
jgi:hypothetical protein